MDVIWKRNISHNVLAERFREGGGGVYIMNSYTPNVRHISYIPIQYEKNTEESR